MTVKELIDIFQEYDHNLSIAKLDDKHIWCKPEIFLLKSSEKDKPIFGLDKFIGIF